MIEKTLVQSTSQNKLKTVLSSYPGLVSSYLNSHDYTRFVDACHVAVNRLELSCMIPSKGALLKWIEEQACIYCEKYLAKQGNKNFKDPNPEKKEFKERLTESYVEQNFD